MGGAGSPSRVVRLVESCLRELERAMPHGLCHSRLSLSTRSRTSRRSSRKHAHHQVLTPQSSYDTPIMPKAATKVKVAKPRASTKPKKSKDKKASGSFIEPGQFLSKGTMTAASGWAHHSKIPVSDLKAWFALNVRRPARSQTSTLAEEPSLAFCRSTESTRSPSMAPPSIVNSSSQGSSTTTSVTRPSKSHGVEGRTWRPASKLRKRTELLPESRSTVPTPVGQTSTTFHLARASLGSVSNV